MGDLAAIFGLGGPEIDTRTRAFFREVRPWGFILFERNGNVRDPKQLRRLTDDLRETVGRDAPVLIDQEGGRVQRLKPPHWPKWSAVLRLFDGDDTAAAEEALGLRYRVIAAHLRDVGIDVNCAPLLDVPAPGCDDIIGDRALGTTAEEIGRRGRIVCEAHLAGGVLPVIKHIPGHGRAAEDSHKTAPRVCASLDELERVDFAAFRAVAGQALAMTAHVIYDALDPERVATESPAAVNAIRQRIGFGGLLMGDDISMAALSGSLTDRATASLGAGCDVVLHCNGDLAEMEEIAAACRPLEGEALARANRAEAARRAPEPFDVAAAIRRYEALTGEDLAAPGRGAAPADPTTGHITMGAAHG